MSVLRKIVGIFCVLALSAGCVTLQSVSLTPVPMDRSKEVTASSEKFLFLGIAFDNDFVDQVTQDLKATCPNGKITGILTKDEIVNYFFYLFIKRRVTAVGYCVKAG